MKSNKMKTLKLFFFGIALMLSVASQAQVSVSVNIGSPPLWGPAGYTEVRYYYLPALEAFYDIQTSMFIYYQGNVWVHRQYLPTRYRNYDLYTGYKVVMVDYRGDAPYKNFGEYKSRYARGYRGETQKTIGVNPGRGNSGAKNSNPGNQRKKETGNGNGKNATPSINRDNSHGNEKYAPSNQSHGGGHGKKK